MIANYQQQRIDGFDVVRATVNDTDGKCIAFVTSDLSPQKQLATIFTKFGVPEIVSARRLVGLDRFT